MNNKFTDNAKQAFNIANRTCTRLNADTLMLEHLFIGILSVQDGIASKVLSRLGLDPNATVKSIEDELAKEGLGGGMTLNPENHETQNEPGNQNNQAPQNSQNADGQPLQQPPHPDENNDQIVSEPSLGEKQKIEQNNSNQQNGNGVNTRQNQSGQQGNKEVIFSTEIKKVLEIAFETSINSGHHYIGTEHLLLSMLNIKGNAFIKELSNLGISYDKVQKELDHFVQYPELPNGADMFDDKAFSKMPKTQGAPVGDNFSKGQKKDSKSAGILGNLGVDLVVQASDGKLDPVIGRDEEITRLMQVISRRTKNNPILIGDAGVGKTAIVEGLAQKIAFGDISPVLANYEIWSIDTASIVAGSQLRGDIETKILDLINEVQQKGNIILFIDEIHTIIGAGSTGQNSLDMANILKPALARGVLHCIGATTIDEYRKTFDEDPALQRRFQPIDVQELNEQDAFTVLKQIKPIYEAFHNVRISDEAVNLAVKLSHRYIKDRYLPDKAIDVLDEACAKNKINRIQLSDTFKKELEVLTDIVNKKNVALQNKNLEEASKLLDTERDLIAKLKTQEEEMKSKWDNVGKIITDKDIVSIVHAWTKIPVHSMETNPAKIVSKLDKDLKTHLIGQDYAVEKVVNSIKRAKAGISGIQRPISSFLFVGPTGVGKTELATKLAESMFGTEEALIRVDMSELMEGHSVSKLVGSPPGYVGHDTGGQLTAKVRRNPYSVVLFDEIEKASPEVLNILLQVLDTGVLTDSKGRKADFKNTIIIMTSNIGSEALEKENTVGLFLGEQAEKEKKEHRILEIEENIKEALKEYLQPEFINRIDDIIIFRELNKKDIYKITKLHVQQFLNTVQKESNLEFALQNEKKILDHIVKIGFSEEYGAREINRAVKNILENIVADNILSYRSKNGTKRTKTKKKVKFQISLIKDEIKIAEVQG